MKNVTLLSLVAASLLFTACGEKTKEAATDAANTVTEAVKEDTASAMEATKKAVADAAVVTKKAAADAAEAAKVEAEKVAAAAAAKAADALKKRAAATTEAVSAAVTPENAAGKAAYAKCAGCHGADGKTKALGKANPVAGQTAAALAEALHGYKAGTRNVSGMGMLMKGQVASMDDATITAVSEYMAGMGSTNP